MEEIQNDLNQVQSAVQDMQRHMDGLAEEEKMQVEEAVKHIQMGLDMMKDQM